MGKESLESVVSNINNLITGHGKTYTHDYDIIFKNNKRLDKLSKLSLIRWPTMPASILRCDLPKKTVTVDTVYSNEYRATFRDSDVSDGMNHRSHMCMSMFTHKDFPHSKSCIRHGSISFNTGFLSGAHPKAPILCQDILTNIIALHCLLLDK